MRLLLVLTALVALASTADAQTPAPDSAAVAVPEPRIIYVERPASERPIHRAPPARRPTARRLSGPRVGVTYLPPAVIERINETLIVDDDEEIISPSFPVITQFGWQFERPLTQTQGGLTALAQTVLLVGGLDRGVPLPSGSFLVGVRTVSGIEVGVGPNLSATGAAYAIAFGVANNLGEVNLPVNLAFVLGRDGVRASVLVGLTFSDDRY